MLTRSSRTEKNKDSEKKNFFLFSIKYRNFFPIYITSKQSNAKHYSNLLLDNGNLNEAYGQEDGSYVKQQVCSMEAAVNSRRKMNYGSTAQSYSYER